ncbi:dockerin type I repeat-containing protein [Ruminococcus sp.]|uniref:dockerin type I repeat-containing protein n=1 Tax=Ruminococcus sp. TaxID=41978 RepID=UPI0025DB7AC1|nr:dockerin type I repeat-containing protein [Ruminococcus sp.]MBQ8965860.1 dockerin type I repeat-containing protein [Ruminococcus sp.]
MKNSKIVAAMTAAAMVVSMSAMVASAAEVDDIFDEVGVNDYNAYEWDITDLEAFFEDEDAVVVITYTDEHDGWGDLAFGFSVDGTWKSATFSNDAGEDAEFEVSVADVIAAVEIEDASTASFGKVEGYNGCTISKIVLKTADAEPSDDDEPADDDVATDDETTADDDVTTGEETTTGDDDTTGDETTTEEEYTTGDINGDGNVDVTDLMAIAAHVKTIRPLTKAGEKAADVNGDGNVDVTDLMAVAAHVKAIRPLY